jgi:general secretion pathway protein J
VTVRTRFRSGFTLIEVLVALLLLALVGLMSWRGLDHVSQQRARADAETLAMDQLLRTLAQLERDLGQGIPDSMFAGREGMSGVLPHALQVTANDEGDIWMSVTRRYPGVHGVRSVSYALEGSVLMRQLSPVDRSKNPDAVAMLDSVSRLEVRFLVDGLWIEARRLQTTAGRARAMEFAIERLNGDRYVQILQL